MVLFGLLWVVIWLALPIAAFVMAWRARRRLDERDRTIAALESRLSALERQARGSTAPPPSPTVSPARPQVAAQPIVPPEARPPVLPSPPPIPPAAAVPPPPREPLGPALPPAPPHVSPPVSARPPSPPPPVRPALPSIDWENLVGVKLFSWIAGVALVFAAIFFLRYSIEHGWLSAPVRMAIGLLTGIGLLVACELRAARRYPVTANALDAAGIAILFATLFASHALWKLLPQLPVFVLMALVTAVAVLLSVRRDSVFIALLGLVGGFATPALLSTGEDRPIGLFGYLLLLNAGLAWVALRKSWPLLTAVSVVFTALYEWGWVLKFLDAARLPLAMSIFLVFPVFHVAAVAVAGRQPGERDTNPLFSQAATVSTLLPVIFALYMTGIPAYGAQYVLLFGFLFLVVLGLSIVAVAHGPQRLYVLGGLSTVLAFVIWFALSYRSAAWPGVLGIIAAFVLLHGGVPLVARRLGRPLVDQELTAVVAPALLFAFPVLVAIEPATAAPGVVFGVLFALLIVLAAVAVVNEQGRVHFLSAFFALAAEAVWSAKHLTPERLLPALTMYAAFGLFYLGVPLIAERLGKKLEPRGSGAVVLFVSLAFLFFLAAGPVAHSALWGMALLLAILNLGLFLEASAGALPLLSFLGMVLSWIVIAVWWATAMVAVLLIPSLMVVAGFALLIMAGSVWARQRAEAGGAEARAAAPLLQQGLYLALVGHLFLLFVASQQALAVPPWPLFGVLVVLDLAIGAAALYTRRAELHGGAVIASQLVLLVWVIVAEVPPWPQVSMVAAGMVVAFALLWMPLSRRRGVSGGRFARVAVASVFLAQAIAITVSGQPVPPAWIWLLIDNVVLLAVLLGLAAAIPWHRVAVWAVVPTTVQGTLWLWAHMRRDTWTEGLLFVGVLYALFLAYPVLLGARARRAREPYLVAVLASLSFFVLARQCILTGGHGDVIGVLPVAQAVCLLGVLVRLLRVEPAGDREPGRLALVAGAALAFITAAIPLQLDRQWITIGWALEGAALAWLYRRIPHRGLLAWSAGLCLAVFIRLSLNPAVFEYHPRGTLPIWNWYLYTYLVAAAALFAAARLLRDTDDHVDEFLGLPGFPRLSDILPGGGAILLFLLLNIEIADFYSTGRALTFNFSAGLAQDLTYTLGWGMFAISMLVIGISRRSRVTRIASLALLVVTVVKAFLHDLWRLGGLYRVGSFVGLAICLALVAVLLQRFVLGAQKEAA
jgi:hypothetical protein